MPDPTRIKTADRDSAFPPAIVYVLGAEVRAVDVRGERQSLVHRVPEGRPSSPCWSPDGQMVAWEWTPGHGIWRTSLAGAQHKQILCSPRCGGPCRNPRWSPLGHEIAIIGDRGSLSLPDALLVVPPEGGRLHALYMPPPGYALLDVAWDRGGRRLAVSEYRAADGGSDRIRVIERDSGLATTVLDDFGQISFLDWAPHREELAFTGASRSGESGIFTYRLPLRGELGTPAPLVLHTPGSRPSYSADGGHLVFQRGSSFRRWKSIHTIDLDSGEERLITPRGMAPSWRKGSVAGSGDQRITPMPGASSFKVASAKDSASSRFMA